MDALIDRLSYQDLHDLSVLIPFGIFVAICWIALMIRSSIVGYAFYKYRAKKRRKLVTIEAETPVEDLIDEAVA